MNRIIIFAAAFAAGATTAAVSAYGLPRVPDPAPPAAGWPEAAPRGPDWPFYLGLLDRSERDRSGLTSHGRAEAIVARADEPRYGALIRRHAARNGVPHALALAVVRIESGFRPNVRGRAGEVGLMQIKPATARLMGYRGSAKGLRDPETNIRFGMRYLGQAYRLAGGTTCGTILKYNAGHGARRMNRISSRYCAKVRRLLGE